MPEFLDRRKMSQADFARKIGVTEGFVSQVIRGDAQFSLLTGKKAADLFGCKIDDLVEWIYD